MIGWATVLLEGGAALWSAAVLVVPLHGGLLSFLCPGSNSERSGDPAAREGDLLILARPGLPPLRTRVCSARLDGGRAHFVVRPLP
jgi:hypothetical protein